MTEQTYAELIADVRSIDADWVLDNSPEDSVETIRELAAALEAAARAMAHADVTNPDGWVMSEEARNVYSDKALRIARGGDQREEGVIMTSHLVRMPVSQIVTFWQPGSHAWSWAEESHELMHGEKYETQTKHILKRVDEEGIDFIDNIAPVLLGSDGRVWDGHHRICIAIKQGIPDLMVDIVEKKEA